MFSFMRYSFSNLPAENFLPNDAKYAAMEIGFFSFHRPGRAQGLCCQFSHGVNKVIFHSAVCHIKLSHV